MSEESPVEIRGDGDNIADIWINGYPVGKLLNSAEKRISQLEQQLDSDDLEEIESRVEMLEQDIASRATADGGENMTKKELAKQISMQEALRRAEKAISGGAVDWPTVRDIADRQYQTDLNSGTVYAAWEDLVDQWTAFDNERGEVGPHGKNRRLFVNTEDVTPSLRKACGNQG